MPAYNYYPATYQPFQQSMYQPQYPQIQQPVQQTVQSGMLWVGNEQEAVSYPVAPNNAVALWDSSRPCVYLKQTDASGKPTLKVYELKELQNGSQSASESREIKNTEYALKSDTDAISREIEAIKSEVKNFKRELNKNKRKEVDDDDE